MSGKNDVQVACPHQEAVYWNQYNHVVQCHRCGTIFGPWDYKTTLPDSIAPRIDETLQDSERSSTVSESTTPDGAHLGMTASQGLTSALSDDPDESVEMTPEQMALYLAQAPDDPNSYDDTSRWAARGVLAYLNEHPEAAELDAFDLFESAFPRGSDGTLSSVHPQLAGITGFMVGWAVNAALYAYGRDAVDNPAIITVED